MSVVKALESLQLEKKNVLVACSGGLDSTVLIHALAQLKIQSTLFHVNYHLREEASDLDQAFVESLGKTFDFPVQVEHCPKELLYGDGINLQNAARSFRRHFFNEWTSKSKNHVVLLGHHADDQVETFFMQISRGSGIFGLAGMHLEKDQIIRPFIHLTKDELLNFAKSNNISWREDQSNQGINYLRNRFRNVFLPSMENEVPDLRKSILILQAAFRNEQVELISSIQDELKDWKEQQIIQLNKWKRLSFEQKLAFTKNVGFESWSIERINSAVNLHLSAKIDLGFTSLVKVKNALKQLKKADEIKLWEFKIEEIEFLPKTFSKTTIYLDREKVKGELKMRFATAEDFIYPIGMQGKQKVFKLLKDNGLPQQEREFQQILCDDEHVLWVPGLKISRKSIATVKSKFIFRISLTHQ